MKKYIKKFYVYHILVAVVVTLPVLILTCCSSQNASVVSADDININFNYLIETNTFKVNLADPIESIKYSPLVPILTYHRITPEEEKYNGMAVSPKKFRRHLQFLVDNQYKPITLNQYYDAKIGKFNLPEKPVIITFDDAWKSQYQNALPILKEFNFRAVFYLYNAVVGNSSTMSWDQLRELIALGHEVGGHSATHSKLTLRYDFEDDQEYAQRLQREISQSKQEIEEKLGTEISHFCYPYGFYDTNLVVYLKRAGYKTSTTVNPANNTVYTPSYMINRMIVGPYTSLKALDEYLTLGELKMLAIIPANGVYCNNHTKALKVVLDAEFAKKIEKVRFKFDWKWKDCEWNQKSNLVKCSFEDELAPKTYSVQIHAWDTNQHHYVYCWQFHQQPTLKKQAI